MELRLENRYSILFVVGRWGVGGVERVTAVLANAFIAKGWNVAIVAFCFENRSLLNGLSPDVEVCELKGNRFGCANRKCLRSMIIRRRVDFVVNQWCLPCRVTYFLRSAMRGTSAKLIAVHHNQPDCCKRMSDSRNFLTRFAWKLLTRLNLRLVYEFSDAYVVLSPSFIDILKRFICVESGERIKTVPNPLTLPVAHSRERENVILYVGRLEETQKRFSRVLSVWETIADKLPDWRLEIVGDGPDRQGYEKMAQNLPRVIFLGYQSPEPYYARSRILLLTSDFEGFGLVLVEAMAHGCVTIVLDSYPAVRDIANEGMKLVPCPFQTTIFSDEVLAIANDPAKLSKMSMRAMAIADRFSVESIVERWTAIFDGLLPKRS